MYDAYNCGSEHTQEAVLTWPIVVHVHFMQTELPCTPGLRLLLACWTAELATLTCRLWRFAVVLNPVNGLYLSRGDGQISC